MPALPRRIDATYVVWRRDDGYVAWTSFDPTAPRSGAAAKRAGDHTYEVLGTYKDQSKAQERVNREREGAPARSAEAEAASSRVDQLIREASARARAGSAI